MHKLLYRVHSHSKDITSDKKKKKSAKSDVKSAFKSTIVAPLALSQTEAASEKPNDTSLPTTSSVQNGNVNVDHYTMASDGDQVPPGEDEIKEDVYENTDSIMLDNMRPTEKQNSIPRSTNKLQNTAEEGFYDTANSLTRDCVVRTTSLTSVDRADNSDTDQDDIYSHLAADSSPTDQLYDRLERKLSDASDVVYDCLGDHESSNHIQTTTPTFEASYEDVDLPDNTTEVVRSEVTVSSIQGDLPQEDEDMYEDISVSFPLYTAASNTYLSEDESNKDEGDDTYEDVSSLPIQRFREQQPLPNLPKPNRQPQTIKTESGNVSPARQVSTSPDITSPIPSTSIRGHATTSNEAKHLFKHSKARHPSQWFSKPFSKVKPKLDLRKRANSKPSSLNLIENQLSPTDVNIRSRERMPTPQEQGRLTAPTRVALADSLEQSHLYKSMQEKLRTPNNDS